ncbi:MAG: hypothetical protein AAGF11_38775 [Myxococcota bacterium]
MIKIVRSDEAEACPELVKIRMDELERVRKELGRGVELTSALIGGKYGAAKQALYEMQHYKCCYCESIQDTHKWNTVEHYRPKTAVACNGKQESGYWWLAWTWDNLLFSCEICNHRKGASFPLTKESTRLMAEDAPPGDEEPLLLDPCNGAEDPREHIQFRPVADSWWPFPRNGSRYGFEMLKALQLFHPELGKVRAGLLSKWRRHAKALLPVIARVKDALRSESAEEIRCAWEAGVIPCLFTNQEFVALSIDIFDHAFDAEVRDRWGLKLEPLPCPLSR